MPKTIWKYAVSLDDDVRIDMPLGAQPLTVQTQDGGPTLWALVDPSMPVASYGFRVFGTGQIMPNDVDVDQYIGTFQLHGGALVFHLFQVDVRALS